MRVVYKACLASKTDRRLCVVMLGIPDDAVILEFPSGKMRVSKAVTLCIRAARFGNNECAIQPERVRACVSFYDTTFVYRPGQDQVPHRFQRGGGSGFAKDVECAGGIHCFNTVEEVVLYWCGDRTIKVTGAENLRDENVGDKREEIRKILLEHMDPGGDKRDHAQN